MSGPEESRRDDRLVALGQAVAGLAHDLRNALNVLGNSLHVVGRHIPQDDVVARKHLGILEYQVESTRCLAEDVLEFARGPVVRRRDCAAAPLVAAAARQAMPGDARAVLEFVLPPDDARVVVDPDAVHRVILELVRNAVGVLDARGDRPGTVTVSALVVGEGLTITVHDDGPGFDAETALRLFEPFFTTRTGGTGLGLAMVRAVAEAHGGGADAQGAPGNGATFTVRLPGPERSDEP